MISVGKTYTIFKPKETKIKGEKGYAFSIGNSDYNKATGEWINKGFINILATTNQFLSDRDKVTIAKITGADTNEYKGNTNVTLFVLLEGELEANYEPTSDDELPF